MKKPLQRPSEPQKQKSKGNKKNYKIRNWKEYNEALVNRGRILFWINEEAIEKWEEPKKAKRKRGRPKNYSDTAIETALTLQQVFRLPLRQTEGFLSDILKKFAFSVSAPDHSTLSIRMKSLPVVIRIRPLRKEPIHIVVDGTGAKVYGEGEWKVRRHGWSKHRRWKKLHIGVDEKTGDILLGEVTGNDIADADMLAPLLEQVPNETIIEQVSADGGYDRRKCYETLVKRKVRRIAIPPQRNAKIWRHGNTQRERLARDENLRRIRVVGRTQWKKESNYHRRSLSETAMFRLKTIFTDRLSARTHERQRAQLLLRCRALNIMTTLGMPKSYVVA